MGCCNYSTYTIEQCSNGWLVRIDTFNSAPWVFKTQAAALVKLKQLIDETRCWECDAAGNHLPDGDE